MKKGFKVGHGCGNSSRVVGERQGDGLVSGRARASASANAGPSTALRMTMFLGGAPGTRRSAKAKAKCAKVGAPGFVAAE